MIGLGSLRRYFAMYRQKRLIKCLNSVGVGVEIHNSIRFTYPERITLGNHVYIGPGGYINGSGGLIIDDHVIIAPEIVIMTSMHRYKEAQMVPYDEVELLKPVNIKRCSWIGIRAIIMPGVTIGEGSIVGAGSVVTKSCPPGSILGGNPATIIGMRDMEKYQDCVGKKQFYLKLKQELGFAKKEKKLK